MLVTPTNLYYSEMRAFLEESEVAAHYPVKIKGLENKKAEKDWSILFELNDLSLSSLRVAYHLELLCRKRVLMREVIPGRVIKYLDLTRLNEEEIQ